MPLRPEVRSLYGPEWRRFRERYAALRPPICSKCNRTHAWMNLAHLAHDPKRRERLVWLCPHCHGINDTPRRIAVTRRTHAKRVGQLWLLPELEFAEAFWWEIPPEMRVQGRLPL